MVTTDRSGIIYYGLSSDTKPEAFNGCPFIEIDTFHTASKGANNERLENTNP